MKRIAVAGSTGSIGTQALDIIARRPDLFEARVLAAGSQVDKLIAQALRFRPALAVIADESKYARLREALEPEGIATACGPTALAEACTRDDVDTVLTATVGYSGLEPTLRAIEAGKDIALANKETLVVAGELVMKRAAASATRIYPVDSEHSAIYQCLRGEQPENVERLIITASGGPFRSLSEHGLEKVTVGQALQHPSWSMGAKITVDSATMLNKAFEIIEARWLFDIPADRITPVVHPQSIVHSMVEFVDGAVMAQLGTPDMKLPIQYALFYPDRRPMQENNIDFFKLGRITFEEPDMEVFTGLKLAYEAFRAGGSMPTVFNAANEKAVSLFLQDKIGFLDIPELIGACMQNHHVIANPTVEQILEAEAACYDYIESRC